MKNFILFLLLILAGQIVFYACKQEEIGQYPVDSIAPGIIKNIEVTNKPGGAIIKYELPSDDDFLYVVANYSLDNGKPMEIKASVYSNELIIEGLGKSRELTVSLRSVDRSKNMSEPVAVKINPLDAPIFSILSTMTIQNDFGGISLNWENPTATPVIIEVITTNENQEMVVAEKFFSGVKIGKANVRGYDANERIFAVVLKDNWGNVTDTISDTFLPMFEQELEKQLFARWNPPGIPYNAYTTPNHWIERFWDNTIVNSIFANYSLEFTFDMGQLAKLSRFKLNQRSEPELIYALGHPKRFELWGSKTPNVNADFDTWEYIGYFESIKPSGLPSGQVSNEDINYAHTIGEEYNVSLDAPIARYIRFVCLETWGQADVVQMNEITVWGDTRVQ